MKTFSSLYRQDYISQISKNLDLLVIGGGITGAGILLDAKLRGLKVGLIEMQDFSSGTSSRSTKLIHGGLRYLKQLEFSLVAEVGRERKIVHELAPHITSPEVMLLPLVKDGSLGKLSAYAGMNLYEYLAKVKPEEKNKMLSKKEALTKEPLLNEEILKGGISYIEYRTDDSRLTIEILKEAASLGAIALNYTKALSFIYKESAICGVNAIDLISNTEYEIKATKVVNATGPWVDTLDSLDDPSIPSRLFLTKGVHIVVDGKKLPIKQSIYFDGELKRMIFAIPREGKVYIGTTDTAYEGDQTNPEINREDKDYLLNSVNKMFNTVPLQLKDIESGWAGLRPLVKQAKKSPSAISRKDEIFIAKSGLITIAGGKLTGYRKMAERVVNIVTEQMQKNSKVMYGACSTDRTLLSGAKYGGAIQYNDFLFRKAKQGTTLGLTLEDSRRLVRRYGSNVDKVFKNIQTGKNEAIAFELPLHLFAEVLYGIEEECVASPSDFFVRRTGKLYFDIETVRTWSKPVGLMIGDKLGYTPKMVQQQLKNLDEEIRIATA